MRGGILFDWKRYAAVIGPTVLAAALVGVLVHLLHIGRLGRNEIVGVLTGIWCGWLSMVILFLSEARRSRRLRFVAVLVGPAASLLLLPFASGLARGYFPGAGIGMCLCAASFELVKIRTTTSRSSNRPPAPARS